MHLIAAILMKGLEGGSPLGPDIPECKSPESPLLDSHRSIHAVQSQADVAVWGTASDEEQNLTTTPIVQESRQEIL